MSVCRNRKTKTQALAANTKAEKKPPRRQGIKFFDNLQGILRDLREGLFLHSGDWRGLGYACSDCNDVGFPMQLCGEFAGLPCLGCRNWARSSSRRSSSM